MTNKTCRRRKSTNLDTTNSDGHVSYDMSDGDVSSQSKSTMHSRRTSPKKLKRTASLEIKQKINWRCDPNKIRDMIAKLSPEQLKWVVELGFGSLIEMIECKLPRKLTIWLIKQVDIQSKCLVFKNRKVSIVDVVQNLLRLPAEDKEVPMPRPSRVRDKPFKGNTDFKSEKAGRGESLQDATDRMIKYTEEKDKDNFCICFMEVILCSYLAPTTGYQINRSYLLGALKDVTDIPRMNWCRFAGEYLIQAISDARNNNVENLNIAGCIHILHLIYVDLLKRNLVTVPEGFPRSKYVGSALLKQIDNTGEKRTTDHCLIFENFLDDEKLAKFPLAEDNDDDLHDTDNSRHSTPPVTTEIQSETSEKKQKQPPNVAHSSKKRQAVDCQDETLIKRIKKLEDHYSAQRQQLTTLFERKLKKKLEELERQKTKDMAALVQAEINKAMVPMTEYPSIHTAEPNDGGTASLGTDIPHNSKLDGYVDPRTAPADSGNPITSSVNVNPDFTTDRQSFPPLMSETIPIHTNASDHVLSQIPEQEQLRSSSNIADHLNEKACSVTKLVPTVQLHTGADNDSSKEVFDQTMVNIPPVQSEMVEAVVIVQTVGSEQISDSAHHQTQTSAPLAPVNSNTSAATISVHLSHVVNNDTIPNPVPSIQSIITHTLPVLTTVHSEQQVIASSVVVTQSASDPSLSNNVPVDKQCNPAVTKDINDSTVDLPQVDSSIGKRDEQMHCSKLPCNLQTSDSLNAEQNKLAKVASIQPAVTPLQVAATEIVPTKDDVVQNTASDNLAMNTMATSAPHPPATAVSILSSPPLSLDTVANAEIMSVSQMTREYDKMEQPKALSIDNAALNAAFTLQKVSTSSPQHLQSEIIIDTDESKKRLEEIQTNISQLCEVIVQENIVPTTTSDGMAQEKTIPPAVIDSDQQNSDMPTTALKDEDRKELDKCVSMILDDTLDMCRNIDDQAPNLTQAFAKNQEISNSIKEVLVENLEQTKALAQIHTQSTAGEHDSSTCECTEPDAAEISQLEVTEPSQKLTQTQPGLNEDQTMDKLSARSKHSVSSERTEDDHIVDVSGQDSDSPTSQFTPRHSLLDIEIVDIPDEPSTPETVDCKHISQLDSPLNDGESFVYAGSINPSMRTRKQRYQRKDEKAEGIAELVKKKIFPTKMLNSLYNNAVANSKFRGLRLSKRHHGDDTGGTKIRIGKASVTEREFVQCLMPKGKICKNFMWLVSVAMMLDWGSKSKVILDQTIITQLLKNHDECDHALVAKKLSKLSLKNVEQLYLPTLSDAHWILIVVNYTQTTIEIYDSNTTVKDGEDPHKVLFDRLS